MKIFLDISDYSHSFFPFVIGKTGRSEIRQKITGSELSGILSALSARRECFAKSCRSSKACHSLYLAKLVPTLKMLIGARALFILKV